MAGDMESFTRGGRMDEAWSARCTAANTSSLDPNTLECRHPSPIKPPAIRSSLWVVVKARDSGRACFSEALRFDKLASPRLLCFESTAA